MTAKNLIMMCMIIVLIIPMASSQDNETYLDYGECPDSKEEINLMYVFWALMLIVGIAGIFVNNIGFCAVSGFLLVFFSMIVWECGDLLGIFSILTGLGIIAYGANIRV